MVYRPYHYIAAGSLPLPCTHKQALRQTSPLTAGLPPLTPAPQRLYTSGCACMPTVCSYTAAPGFAELRASPRPSSLTQLPPLLRSFPTSSLYSKHGELTELLFLAIQRRSGHKCLDHHTGGCTCMPLPSPSSPLVRRSARALWWVQITWDVATAFDMSDDSIFPMLAAGGSRVADVVLDPSVPVDRRVKLIPLQLHWHETSEHAWDGLLVRPRRSLPAMYSCHAYVAWITRSCQCPKLTLCRTWPHTLSIEHA